MSCEIQPARRKRPTQLADQRHRISAIFGPKLALLGPKMHILGQKFNSFGTITVQLTINRLAGCYKASNGQNGPFGGQKSSFLAQNQFFGDVIQIFCCHHGGTPKRQLFCVDCVARRASGRPPGPIFGPKMCIFLLYAHITPIFWARTDPTQWDHNFPTS